MRTRKDWQGSVCQTSFLHALPFPPPNKRPQSVQVGAVRGLSAAVTQAGLIHVTVGNVPVLTAWRRAAPQKRNI